VSRPRLLLITAVVLVVAAGTVAWFATRSRTANGQPQTCSAPDPLSTRPASAATTAPSHGGLRVVERGFSQLGDEGFVVSLGAVVENTSDQVAYRTRIAFRVLDAQGQPATVPDSRQLRQEIPVILPGRRVVVGAFAYVADRPRFTKATVASFELELGTTQWWPQAGDGSQGNAFADVTAAYQRTDRYDPAAPGSAVVYYAATSTACHRLTSRGVAAVFRDSSGTIVGGTLDNPHTSAEAPCSPGTQAESLSTLGFLPPKTDDRHTEVSVFCDLAPKPVTGTSDAPYN
jgi:hypothetical protein